MVEHKVGVDHAIEENLDLILNAMENGGEWPNPTPQVCKSQMASQKAEGQEDEWGVRIVLMDGGDGPAWSSEH